jgi:hypothetical protein
MNESSSQPEPLQTPSVGSGRPDQRRHPRARAEWPITIVLDDGAHRAMIRDVSRGGVCFFLDRPIEEMTVLRIEFDLPRDAGIRKVSGVGAVVRCERISKVIEHYEIAVFMTDMAEPDRAVIAEYVEDWRSGSTGA